MWVYLVFLKTMRIVLYLLLAVAVATPTLSLAQRTKTEPETVYQLSGLVLNREDNIPLSYTRISTVRKRRIVVADENGYFSIPVVAGDTLVFTRVGFAAEHLSIAEYLAQYKPDSGNVYIYAIQYMMPEDYVLDTVYVRPYNTPTELKTAILNMPTQTRLHIETINHRVDAATMAYFMNNLPTDDEDRMVIARQRYIEYYQQRGSVQAANVDPIAVYNFIKFISQKNKKN